MIVVFLVNILGSNFMGIRSTEKSTKNAIYNWLHILSYFSAIVARKTGYTFEQIPSLFNGYDEEKLLSFIESTDQPFSKSKTLKLLG